MSKELAFIQGKRAVWTQILRECLRELGYDNPEAQQLNWILERETAIAQLRELCTEFGDNDWADEKHLGDVIEKHLGRHLYDNADEIVNSIRKIRPGSE